jgi:ribonuclease HII
MPPDLSYESALSGVICGIDEVGRGPLAGPVVAAAVVLPAMLPALLLTDLDDSKLLSAAKRGALLRVIVAAARIGIGMADVAEIDRLNILRATFLAMARALAALQADGGPPVDWALVDGNQEPPLGCRVQCVVKGDRRSLSIASASVVAKEHRDALMRDLAVAFPGYGWERNVGYGTSEHREALCRLGLTPHHRRSFAPIGDLFADQPIRAGPA